MGENFGRRSDGVEAGHERKKDLTQFGRVRLMVLDEVKKRKRRFFNRKELMKGDFVDICFMQKVVAEGIRRMRTGVENFFLAGRLQLMKDPIDSFWVICGNHSDATSHTKFKPRFFDIKDDVIGLLCRGGAREEEPLFDSGYAGVGSRIHFYGQGTAKVLH